MIRLIRFLITGDWHLHEWEPYGPNMAEDRLPIAGGIRNPNQPCRCKRCGKIKSFKL